jgi:hypothetical protein
MINEEIHYKHIHQTFDLKTELFLKRENSLKF